MLATPYALFMALFIILPIVLIAVYAFMDKDGAFPFVFADDGQDHSSQYHLHFANSCTQ